MWSTIGHVVLVCWWIAPTVAFFVMLLDGICELVFGKHFIHWDDDDDYDDW